MIEQIQKRITKLIPIEFIRKQSHVITGLEYY